MIYQSWKAFYNALDLNWNCPDCGLKQEHPIRFEYGPCYAHHYALGGKIDWTAEGPLLRERYPDGTGVALGWAQCPNYWWPKWYQEYRKLDPAQHGEYKIPSQDEQERFGCKGNAFADIHIRKDVIGEITISNQGTEPPDRMEGALPERSNYLAATWTCPFCGYPYPSSMGSILFEYGPYEQTYHFNPKYKIGSKFDFRRQDILRDRFPDGSGIVKGRARCPNQWLGRWHGSTFWAAVPTAIRRQYGCPREMNVQIEVSEDVIVRVFFPSNLAEVCGDAW